MLIALIVSIVLNLLVIYVAYYILNILNEMWAIKYNELTVRYIQLAADSKELVNASKVLIDRVNALNNLQDTNMDNDEIEPVIKPTKDQLN